MNHKITFVNFMGLDNEEHFCFLTAMLIKVVNGIAILSSIDRQGMDFKVSDNGEIYYTTNNGKDWEYAFTDVTKSNKGMVDLFDTVIA